MLDPFADELAFAVATAEDAGRLLAERFGRDQVVRRKGARDLVTEADEASERLILDAIRAAYPDDGVLAEESGASHATDLPARVWVIDPLDGTVNYASGLPVFAVSIALVVDGRPTIGVVRDPILGESFAGGLGLPSTLDGRRLPTPDKAALSDCVVSISLPRRGTRGRRGFDDRSVRANLDFGSAALELAWVAAGRLDAFVHGGLSVWDVAAAGLIAEGTGAVVTTSDPRRPWFRLHPSRLEGGIVAAGPSVHAALRPYLEGTG